MSKEPGSFKQFLARKNVVFSAKRYGIDALGAMAQGLFASLLMGTILSTLGQQIGFELLVTIGDYAKGICLSVMLYRHLHWSCFHCWLSEMPQILWAVPVVRLLFWS